MISVVIPTYNEEKCIAPTIHALFERGKRQFITEVIVSDGGSTDNTIAEAERAGALVIRSPGKGRSAQMNSGAAIAREKLLYFLHADTIPPRGFTEDIINAVSRGFGAGCFMLAFDYSHWFLKANCWFTRFDFNYFRFGDQSLFIQKDLFERAGGFCEQHVVMEDQEIITRVRKLARFEVIRKPVLTSARKYLENGIYKTQAIFFLIFFMYMLGYPQRRLVSTYQKLIRQDKV